MKRGGVEVSVVVPTYNEAENIPVLLRRLDEAMRGVSYEVIVVDDDSPDGTWRVAEELSSSYPVRVVVRRGERGLGSAIVEGIRRSRGRYVVVMDADLQHPPELVPVLYRRALETGADVVVASRYARGGGVRGWSRLRLAMSRAASLLAYLVLAESRKTSDPMSGFFLVRRSVAEEAGLEGRSWKVLLELLAKAPQARVVDVPYVFERRHRGESKLGPRAVAGYVADLVRLGGRRVAKFAAVGASGTLVNLLVLWLLHGALSVTKYAAFPAAFEASLTWNFALHDAWTFRGARRQRGPLGWIRYWLRYHEAAAASMAAYLGLGLGLSALGLNYLLAALAGIAAGFASNYLLSQYRVWELHRRR